MRGRPLQWARCPECYRVGPVMFNENRQQYLHAQHLRLGGTDRCPMAHMPVESRTYPSRDSVPELPPGVSR